MALGWRDDLLTGVDEIDDQHREIFRRFGALLTACQEEKAHEEVLRLLLFLDEYTVTHFTAEERLMLACGYRDYLEHKRQHQQFVRQLAELKRTVSQGGVGLTTILATNQMMISWLTGHIERMDKEIARYTLK